MGGKGQDITGFLVRHDAEEEKVSKKPQPKESFQTKGRGWKANELSNRGWEPPGAKEAPNTEYRGDNESKNGHRRENHAIETHIRPKWCYWTLRKLTSKGAYFTIEQWFKSLDLAPKTKGNIRNVMAVIFNCAMRWGLIDLGTNPVSLVRVNGVSRRQKEPRVLNSAEIQTLIAKLEDHCRTA